MPYIPTKAEIAKNRERTKRPLSDDEAEAILNTGGPMSDEDAFGSDFEIAQPERTWAEWGRDTIGGIVPDEVLAAGGVLMGEGSYDENMKTVETNRKRYDRPGDDRDLSERRQGYILNALDNALFGYGDEVVAGGAALMGADYDKALADVEKKHQRYRDLEDDWSAANIGSGAAGFIGGTPLFTGLYKGAQGAIRGVRSLPSVVRGAPAMAAAPVSTVGKIAETVGALGITGGAAGEVAASGNATGGIGQRMAVIGDDVGRVVMNTGLGAAIGVAGPAATKAGEKFYNLVMRNPENKAARYLAEKFLASGKTIDEFAADYAGAAKGGKPVAPVDVAPTSVKDAGTAAARMPGSGRDRAQEFLKTRQEGMGSRVADDMEVALGKPPGSFVQTADDIAAQRAAEAKPHYDRAFSGNKPVSSPKVVELTNRPSGKSAIQQGLKMAQDEGIPMSELVITDARGNVIGYTMKAMHYGKMALDDMIDSAVRSGNGQAARNLTTLKNQWLAEMDRISPDYAAGRKVYAGHAANQRALEMGRKGVNAHPDQIAKEMAGMSKSEQEFYRQGFMQRMQEQIESAPDKGNVVNRIFGTKAKRDRMKQILGDEKYNELAKKYELEGKMYETYADVNVGSPTAQRTAAQADLNEGIAAMSPEAATGLGRSMASGSITPLLNAIGWNRFQGMLNGIGEKTRAEIVRLLFSTDPAEVRAGLALLNKHYAAAQKMQKIQQGVGAAGAGNENTRTYGGGAVVTGTQAAGQAAAPYVPGI